MNLAAAVVTGKPGIAQPQAVPQTQQPKESFSQVLDTLLQEQEGVSFSKHAAQRAAQRSIDLSADNIARLNAGVRWNRKGRTIRKVAVLGGAGGDYLQSAAAAGADALVTGEAKHHEYLEAVRMGITLLDATHYATEQVVLRPLAEYLTACCPDVRFAVGCGGDALCFTGGCRG